VVSTDQLYLAGGAPPAGAPSTFGRRRWRTASLRRPCERAVGVVAGAAELQVYVLVGAGGQDVRGYRVDRGARLVLKAGKATSTAIKATEAKTSEDSFLRMLSLPFDMLDATSLQKVRRDDQPSVHSDPLAQLDRGA
jgi:hypothetical protein